MKRKKRPFPRSLWNGIDTRALEREIARWKFSPLRRDQLCGERYYTGEHEILKKRRTAVGGEGGTVELYNLPNTKIVDNQYAKMVDQKVNYLLGKPPTFETPNPAYAQALRGVFNNRFLRLLRRVGEDSLNGGIGWLYPCYGENGEFLFRRFAPYEILPFWKDAAHTELLAAVRVYEERLPGHERTAEHAELFTPQGVYRYRLESGTLREESQAPTPYATAVNGEQHTPLNWNRIPLIPFAGNARGIPLICRVKSLQDGINLILSVFSDHLQEDVRNTILVLVNYDGENLAEFRRNLSAYGAVKVRTVDGAPGDLKTLQVQVNAGNYEAILNLMKKALIENARGFDAKDERLSGNPNQMNIQSMYSDIDLDANGMETEFQASFEELLYFVNAHLANTGYGDFSAEPLQVVFNRDVLVNESQTIADIQNSVGLLSERTLIAQHPYVRSVEEELLQKQKEAGTVAGVSQTPVQPQA